jgi:hypothetical protein
LIARRVAARNRCRRCTAQKRRCERQTIFYSHARLFSIVAYSSSLSAGIYEANANKGIATRAGLRVSTCRRAAIMSWTYLYKTHQRPVFARKKIWDMHMHLISRRRRRKIRRKDPARLSTN